MSWSCQVLWQWVRACVSSQHTCLPFLLRYFDEFILFDVFLTHDMCPVLLLTSGWAAQSTLCVGHSAGWGLYQCSLSCCFLSINIFKLDLIWFWRDIVLIYSFHLFHVLHGVSSHLMSASLGKFYFICCVLYDGILSHGKSQFVFMFLSIF